MSMCCGLSFIDLISLRSYINSEFEFKTRFMFACGHVIKSTPRLCMTYVLGCFGVREVSYQCGLRWTEPQGFLPVPIIPSILCSANFFALFSFNIFLIFLLLCFSCSLDSVYLLSLAGVFILLAFFRVLTTQGQMSYEKNLSHLLLYGG